MNLTLRFVQVTETKRLLLEKGVDKLSNYVRIEWQELKAPKSNEYVSQEGIVMDIQQVEAMLPYLTQFVEDNKPE